MPSKSLAIKGDHGDMALYLSVPKGPGPFAGIVVAQHRGGVDDFIKSMADRLADAGFVAAAPDLYHRLGANEERSPRALKDSEMIEDVQAVVGYLEGQENIDGNALGITGFCMGGRVVYLMAAALAKFKAAVAYYGGNIMVPLGEGGPSPFQRSAQINCPLMFHFGAEDSNPSPEDMKRLDVELRRCNKEHHFFAYPGAGHAFMDASRQRYNAAADRASWPRTVEFFRRHLGLG